MVPLILIAALFVYLLLGVVVLGRLSRNDPTLWPDPDLMGLRQLTLWPVLVVAWLRLRLPDPAGGAPLADAATVELVGRTGVAVSGLRPWGKIEIEGRRYQARGVHEFIEAGQQVQVVARESRGLVVRPAANL